MFEYYLPSTNDRTDRTQDIRQMLERFGTCHLGSGLYVVSGVNMPDCTTLTGEGSATTLLLREELERGCAVKLGSFCTIRQLHLKGAAEDVPAPAAVGDRHGILFEGNAVPGKRTDEVRNCIISGCFITGFSGGGITCRDTGYNSVSSVIVSHCHILNCGAGIYISHFSEFHKFDSVLSEHCRYGCINNGGNNIFTNCGFNNNGTALLMDNSQKQSPNNSHGSFVGCSFNHCGGNGCDAERNKGIGIMALGTQNGHLFSGCHCFYGKIILENTAGFLFENMLFGKEADITVRGGGLTMFSGSAFSTPTDKIQVEDNGCVKFINCFEKKTGAPVGV